MLTRPAPLLIGLGLILASPAALAVAKPVPPPATVLSQGAWEPRLSGKTLTFSTVGKDGVSVMSRTELQLCPGGMATWSASEVTTSSGGGNQSSSSSQNTSSGTWRVENGTLIVETGGETRCFALSETTGRITLDGQAVEIHDAGCQ